LLLSLILKSLNSDSAQAIYLTHVIVPKAGQRSFTRLINSPYHALKRIAFYHFQMMRFKSLFLRMSLSDRSGIRNQPSKLISPRRRFPNFCGMH
jgi:hypothetical protein